MPFADGSINLNWAAYLDNALAIGSYSLADSGIMTLLERDPTSQRGYMLTGIDRERADNTDKPPMYQLVVFAADPIGDAECDAKGESVYLLNETAVHFLSRESNGELAHGMLQIRVGDSFIGLKAAGVDPFRTAIILTTDRAESVFTLSVLEAPVDAQVGTGSQAVPLALLWNKAWADRITASSISRDGKNIAVAVGKGDIALITRERRTVWANPASGEDKIVAIAVDTMGSIVSVSDTGQVKCLRAHDGRVLWEHNIPVGENRPPDGTRQASVAVDDRCGLALVAVNTSSLGEGITSSYTFIDASTGELLWQDSLSAGISGVSISPSGIFAALTTFLGETLLFSSENHKPTFNETTSSVIRPTDLATLVKRASVALEAYKYEDAIGYLNEASAIDPGLGGHSSILEESIWALREAILNETKAVNRDNLAKVQAALKLVPYDERLTIRRNALARILAEGIGREATILATAGEIEPAVELLRDAINIDPTQVELRQTLRSVTDVVAIRLFKDADDALHEEKFSDAINILIRLEALRPGEEAVIKRLEVARGVQAFAAGMKCYVKARYTEACFWYRKALALNPENQEADRYLQMAARFAQQHKSPAKEVLKPISIPQRVKHERTSTV